MCQIAALVDTEVIVRLAEGASMVCFEVISRTLMQRICSRDVLGRVLGIQSMISGTGKLLGSVLASGCMAAIGLRPAMVVIATLAFTLLALLGPRVMDIDADAGARRHSIRSFTEVFGWLDLFEEASLAALERMAMEVVVELVAVGEVLVCLGTHPDEVFVVRAGRFSIVRDGLLANTPGTDDWFGEVGLLRGIPRNATVVAVTEGIIWRIPGKSFLAAVTSTPLESGRF